MRAAFGIAVIALLVCLFSFVLKNKLRVQL